jgi:hypothetical protein
MSVRVAGDSDGLGLAGVPDGDGPPRLLVLLDDAPAPAGQGEAVVVRWWRGAPGERREGELVVATDGPGLWSRAPWPVGDGLFALPPARPGAVLVVESEESARERAVAALSRRGLRVTGAARLTVAGVAGADAVIHRVGIPRPLPGDALAVLAAGRLLVTSADPGFGLRRGIDHLAAEGIDPAADLLEAAFADPVAFAPVRRTARLTAARHAASAVYARVLADAAG